MLDTPMEKKEDTSTVTWLKQNNIKISIDKIIPYNPSKASKPHWYSYLNERNLLLLLETDI